MKLAVSSQRPGPETPPLPLTCCRQPLVPDAMTNRYWMMAGATVLTLLVIAVAVLGLTKTLVLLAKIYAAIFVLLFLAAFLTGVSGSRHL